MEVPKVDTSVRVFMPYTNDINQIRYHKITWNNLLLSTNLRDNCCILKDGSICIVFNIFEEKAILIV